MAHGTQLHSIPITHARINLGGVVRQAYLQKKTFILEKDGIPVAGILGIEDFEDWLEMSDPQLKRDIKKGYKEYMTGKTKSLDLLLAKLT